MHTVLIVDDEPLIREGLYKLIDWEALGYTIIADMASAEEAMESILALKPDLLITDVKLPGVSGINTGDGCNVWSSDSFYHWGGLLGLLALREAQKV